MNLVEFPGLWGLKFNINRVAFEVFGIPIYWYGIIIAMGFLIAVLLGMKNSKLAGMEPDNVLDMVLIGAPVAIVCARLFYVIFSWDLFKDNLIDIFNTRKGGLAIYGGVLGALVVAYFYSKRKKIGFFKLMDFCAPYIIMAQGIGRWGNFVNQEAFGGNTKLPWGMTSEAVRSYLENSMEALKNHGIIVDPNVPVHPTFLYESLWNFAVFAFLIWYRKRKKLDGEVFFLYMALYGVGRFFIEGLRTDSLMLGSFRISQLLAALFVITFITLFIYRRKKVERYDEEVPAEVGLSQYGSVIEKLRKENEIAEDAHKTDAGEASETVDESDVTEADAAEELYEPDASENEGGTEPANQPETEERGNEQVIQPDDTEEDNAADTSASDKNSDTGSDEEKRE